MLRFEFLNNLGAAPEEAKIRDRFERLLALAT
jgi:hypothetical protein